MNYVVMDDYEEDIYNNVMYANKKGKNKSNHNRIIIIIIGFIALIILFYLMSGLFGKKNNFDEIEKEMVLEATRYVNDNNLSTEDGLYIKVDKLTNVNLNNDCSNLSGVVVEGKSYYPYLICDNYKSDIINNEEKYAMLNGDEIVVVDKNYEYRDLGVSSEYTVETITNYVNREGIYTYLYRIKDNSINLETIKRKVIVIDNQNNNQNYPNVMLNGDEIIYLTKGEIYNEQGVTAIDNKDGDISSKVNIINNVNYDVIGEYEIKYTVTNSQGYSSIATRKIIIGEKIGEGKLLVNSISTPVGYTNSSVTVIIMITGDNYKHTLLPDGTINTNTLIEYEALENDVYNFLVYDNDDNVITEQIEVNNIDKEVPNAICNAVTYKNYTEVFIKDVSESSCVYNYETDSYSSIYISGTEYKMPIGDIQQVSVNIKDVAGNIGKVDCTLEKDISVINKEYVTEKGYNCIEPYTCLKQGDYWDARYCYYSTSTCGPISQKGCSITSIATILSKWDKRSSNGELFTPYTLLREVYEDKIGCTSCSGDTASKKVFNLLGLEVVNNKTYDLKTENADILLNHLQGGNPALIRVGKGWYTNSGHLMALLTANEEGLVYLSDPAVKLSTRNSFGHDVNTFVPLSDVIKGCGSSCWFIMIKE